MVCDLHQTIRLLASSQLILQTLFLFVAPIINLVFLSLYLNMDLFETVIEAPSGNQPHYGTVCKIIPSMIFSMVSSIFFHILVTQGVRLYVVTLHSTHLISNQASKWSNIYLMGFLDMLSLILHFMFNFHLDSSSPLVLSCISPFKLYKPQFLTIAGLPISYLAIASLMNLILVTWLILQDKRNQMVRIFQTFKLLDSHYYGGANPPVLYQLFVYFSISLSWEEGDVSMACICSSTVIGIWESMQSLSVIA